MSCNKKKQTKAKKRGTFDPTPRKIFGRKKKSGCIVDGKGKAQTHVGKKEKPWKRTETNLGLGGGAGKNKGEKGGYLPGRCKGKD